MSIKENLLRSRSYIAVITGFMIAFGVVYHVEKNYTPNKIKVDKVKLSHNFPQLPTTRELTFDEEIWARTAWQYFVNNTQPSGLINTADNLPYTNLWDIGNYLMALVSAHQLGIIERVEFDNRVSNVTHALLQLPLNDRQLPHLYYHSDSLAAAKTTFIQDYSPIDIGRLLIAIQTITWRYPEHAHSLQSVINRWQLNQLFPQYQPPGLLKRNPRNELYNRNDYRFNYGYMIYAAKSLMMTAPQSAITLTDNRPILNYRNYYGIDIPAGGSTEIQNREYPVINSTPYILIGLENGFDTEIADLSWRIIQVQEQFNRSVKNHVYMNADYVSVLPKLATVIADIHNQQAASKTQVLPNHPPLTLSTKAAFGWYALFRNRWSHDVRQQSIALLEPGRGFREGINADDLKSSTLITANTNAIVLESLAYIAGGQMLCLSCLNASQFEAPDNLQSQ